MDNIFQALTNERISAETQETLNAHKAARHATRPIVEYLNIIFRGSNTSLGYSAYHADGTHHLVVIANSYGTAGATRAEVTLKLEEPNMLPLANAAAQELAERLFNATSDDAHYEIARTSCRITGAL